MIEFDCAECGAHVFSAGFTEPPQDRLCAHCHWLGYIEDPVEREEIRTQLKKSGVIE